MKATEAETVQIEDQGIKQEKGEVTAFLAAAIPGLSDEDMSNYAAILKEEGFDNRHMLGLLEEEDLVNFKKAHRRAVLKELEKIRSELKSPGPHQTVR